MANIRSTDLFAMVQSALESAGASQQAAASTARAQAAAELQGLAARQ